MPPLSLLGRGVGGEGWKGGDEGTEGGGGGAALGKVIGPSFARDDVPDVIERLIECYLEHRDSEHERFIDIVRRIGIDSFKEYVYGNADQRASHRRRQLAVA